MKGGDSELLAAGGDVLGSHHGGVGRGLIAISLDLHSSGAAGDGLASTEIGDMLQRAVDRAKGVAKKKKKRRKRGRRSVIKEKDIHEEGLERMRRVEEDEEGEWKRTTKVSLKEA